MELCRQKDLRSLQNHQWIRNRLLTL